MNEDLKAEIERLKEENEHLREAQVTVSQLKHRDRLQLEHIVVERTRELSDANTQLRKEIAERKQAEAQARQHYERLAHVARLNTVGEMASGLAHEINQPLTAIASYTQGCLQRLRSTNNGKEVKEQLESTLEQIVVQAQRAANIVQHLRNFVIKGKPQRQTTDISAIIKLAVSMVRSQIIKHEIELHITQEKSLPRIEVDSIQIEQVILNLLRNAIEAMQEVPPETRKLHIDVSRYIDEQKMDSVSIAIHDTGLGVASHNEGKVSTPFFSTKDDGMGLGLAISRTIVEDHGGRLGFHPNIGGGTTFNFTLAASGRRTSL